MNCWIGGLSITGFSGAGISLLPAPNLTVDQGSIGDVVWGNEIGVGTANGVGIAVSSPSNVIGGTTAPDIALSTTPLVLGSVNIIQGNTVAGIMISGTAGIGNIVEGDEVLNNTGDGILVESSNNLIGASVGNLIAGNQQNGIHIVGATAGGLEAQCSQETWSSTEQLDRCRRRYATDDDYPNKHATEPSRRYPYRRWAE